MELIRKAAMAAATLALALGVGFVVQRDDSTQLGGAVRPVDSLDQNTPGSPTEIVALAAGLAPVAAPRAMQSVPDPARLPATAFARSIGPTASALVGDRGDCPISLDVIASAQATLDLTLIAPCRASERVVLRHGGIAVTGMTSVSGTLFTSLPGMDAAGDVSVLFADGQEVSSAGALPDLSLYRRFAVQWMADDAFQINAFENSARYGQDGHVSAATVQQRLPNVPLRGGYLSVLGDGSAQFPMLAEVYTFPLDPSATVDLTIEASVTQATCGRELLGEMLLSEGGAVTKIDLSMATPTCDAIGDVLVLNNPLPDLKLAAAN